MNMTATNQLQYSMLHPLASSKFAELLHELNTYGFDLRYSFRVMSILAMCILRQPLMMLESNRFGHKIEKQEIHPRPVFIIGHWRSGTTHLQNLLGQDPRLGRVTLLQASMPHEFLTLPSIMKQFYKYIIPSRRIMDNVELSPGMPWEEEMAMANYSPYSFYKVSFFPREVERIFRHSVMFDGNETQHVEAWKRYYLSFLRKIQFTQPGKALLLKNPANTARIHHIQQLLPGSRFIFIHRHPYEVYTSTVHLYTKVQSAWGLQSVDSQKLVQHILSAYRKLMNAYFDQRTALSARQLIEVAYNDLESDPLATIKKIYQQLDLEDFEQAEPYFIKYLDQTRGYIKNNLNITPEEKRDVARHWTRTFTEYGYTA
jgi:hypothetical protein